MTLEVLRRKHWREAKKFILQVEVTNLPTLNLYLTKGYKVLRRIENFYRFGRDAYEAFKTILPLSESASNIYRVMGAETL